MVENYLVKYEIPIRDGARYRSSYSVYLYELDGKGIYLVKEPYVSPDVASMIAGALGSLSTWLAPSPIISIDPIGYFYAEMKRTGLLQTLEGEELDAANHYLLRELLGYGLIDPLIRDPEIEDISCEGVGKKVKVWHGKFNARGWLESNVGLESSEVLDSAVARLVHRSHRSVSTSSPIVDAVLPEGYRLAATWGREVSTQGSSFSIRKLRVIPYTISELIRLGTLDSKIAAYLWMLLEMKGFVIVAGVTASGKTTLANSLATVLNPNWKILSIEDTREINLPHSGWKPLHTRYSRSDGANITLFDLVKLSLRERPDFVILGESRGEEVQVLFQSAASGSGCLTTFHASHVEGMKLRMTQPPLSVASSSLDLIDAVVFMVRGEGGTRYIESVVEVGEEWRALFKREAGSWDGDAGESFKLERRGAGFGLSGKKISFELERRTAFLERVVGKGVCDYEKLSKELSQFYLSSNLTF